MTIGGLALELFLERVAIVFLAVIVQADDSLRSKLSMCARTPCAGKLEKVTVSVAAGWNL